MKSYIVYTRNTEEVVNAEKWDIDDSNLLAFYINGIGTIAVFNMNNIDGFKEIELLTE